MSESRCCRSPPRTDGGHRLYSEPHLRRLHFIRRSRRLGFTLDEIRSLLVLADGESQTCAQVCSLTAEHLDDVRRKIDDLKKMEAVLVAMVDECEQNNTPSCPIIDTLLRPVADGRDQPPCTAP